MNIEPITAGDIQACAEIYNHYVLHTDVSLEEEALTAAQYGQRVRSVTEKYPFFVAREGAQVVGFAYLSPFNERAGYRVTADLSIYVREGDTHRHVGSALWAALEPLARNMGLRSVVSIITGNNKRSMAFHEKQGFVLEGTLHDVAEKFGRRLDVCFYRRAL